jgi:hypothetical protein
MRRTIVLLAALAVASCGSMAKPPRAPAAAPFVSKLTVPGHHPKANKRWPVRVTAFTRSGRALRATCLYLFVWRGQVVSQQGPTPHGRDSTRPQPFRGVMYDPSFTWPARAVGIPLTLRVRVTVKGRGTINHNYSVRVRR